MQVSSINFVTLPAPLGWPKNTPQSNIKLLYQYGGRSRTSDRGNVNCRFVLSTLHLLSHPFFSILFPFLPSLPSLLFSLFPFPTQPPFPIQLRRLRSSVSSLSGYEESPADKRFLVHSELKTTVP